jgi:hypothetical protein
MRIVRTFRTPRRPPCQFGRLTAQAHTLAASQKSRYLAGNGTESMCTLPSAYALAGSSPEMERQIQGPLSPTFSTYAGRTHNQFQSVFTYSNIEKPPVAVFPALGSSFI